MWSFAVQKILSPPLPFRFTILQTFFLQSGHSRWFVPFMNECVNVYLGNLVSCLEYVVSVVYAVLMFESLNTLEIAVSCLPVYVNFTFLFSLGFCFSVICFFVLFSLNLCHTDCCINYFGGPFCCFLYSHHLGIVAVSL